MLEPKVYRISENITPTKLLQNGFKDRGDCYFSRKTLYGGYVCAYLYIEKEDNCLIVKVQDNDGNPYSPFYNPNDRHNNRVYLEVVENYTKYMDFLVNKGILDYAKEDKITMEDEYGDEVEIPIVYHADIEKLHMTENGDWCDLRVAEDTFIPLNESKKVSLGVSMKLPKGHEANFAPRSSTFDNYGIIQTNHLSVIDNSFSGTNDVWKFPAYCLVAKDTVNGVKGTMLHKNDRICQFRINKKQPHIRFKTVNKLDDKDRGGFGTTGRN